MGWNREYLLKSFLLYYAMDDNKNAPLERILPHCAGMPVGPLAPPNFWPFLLLPQMFCYSAVPGSAFL